MPLKPMTLHNVGDKDLGEIVRIGRKEAKRMLGVPFVFISCDIQKSSIGENDRIIHVKEEKRRFFKRRSAK